jgi:GNAT superfamily N-acetyltransferase
MGHDRLLANQPATHAYLFLPSRVVVTCGYPVDRREENRIVAVEVVNLQMDKQDVMDRIFAQRATRYRDAGPSLAPVGSARFRLEVDRVRLAFASVSPGRSRELVSMVVRFARARRLQLQWTVVPERTGETELVAALDEAGFQKTEDLLLMACNGRVAGNGRIAGTSSRAITVSPILNRQLMQAYEYGSRLCFYGESHPEETAVTKRATERWSEQQAGWFSYYAALESDRLLGGCYVSLFEDVPTLMGVYTLPQARKQGVASQLISYVVGDLLSSDRDVCCLFVERGNPARNLYLELGFVPLADMITFILDAD